MKIATILTLLIGFLGSALGYAMDWQLKQDQKINDLDMLILKQTIILEQQIKINEKYQERRMTVPNFYEEREHKEVTE